MNTIAKRLRKLNLIWKLTILYMVIISIPLTFITYYFYKQSYRQIIENYNILYNEQLYQSETTIRKEMSKAEFLSQSICNDNSLRKYLEFYSRDSDYDFFLISVIAPYLDNVSLLNSDIFSFLIYSSNNSLPRFQNIIFNEDVAQDENWYNEFSKHPYLNTLWDFPQKSDLRDLNGYKNGVSKENVISLHSKIISNYTSKDLGFLEININTENILGYGKKNEDNQYRLMLLNKSDNTVYEFFKDTYEVNTWNQLNNKSSQGYRIIMDGKNRYIALRKDIDELNSRLVLLYPYKYIQNTLAEKAYIIIMLAIIILISISLIGYLVTNIILKRLKILVDTMKIVQEGNFDVKVEIQSYDEIGELNKAFNMMVCKINNLITTVYIKEITEKKTMLSYLQAQLNPHFLFNSLESIRMLSEAGRNNDASDAIFCLSKLMRSHFTMKNKIDLSEELELVKAYIDLQNIRFNKKIRLQINMLGDFDRISIPPLILEPLAENSVKHGFKNSGKICLIRIKIQQLNEKIYKITVTDNGKGVCREQSRNIGRMLLSDSSSPAGADTECHIGLMNINTRIRLNYGEGYGLKFFSYEGRGTVIQLTIPCN